MNQKFSLSICADDYGITHNVNKAIIKLISNKRLTETSCIVLTENFKKDAKKLMQVKTVFQPILKSQDETSVIIDAKQMISDRLKELQNHKFNLNYDKS